jgi:hypothetical protein
MVTTLSIDPPSVTVGGLAVVQVGLSGPVPAGGAAVDLAVEPASAVAIRRINADGSIESSAPIASPMTIQLPAGALSSGFPIRGEVSGDAQITVTMGTVSRPVTLTIRP